MVPVPALPPPTARASVVITWNTGAAAVQPAIQYGTLTAITGTHLVVRLSDGTYRRYTASAAEAAALRGLIGKTIAFRTR
jgi:hypothetical protein